LDKWKMIWMNSGFAVPSVAGPNCSFVIAVSEFTVRGWAGDLFFHLNVILITLPPLRERKEDIPLLVELFVQKYSLEVKKPEMHFTPAALGVLEEYDWPGNIRELENVIERAVVLSTGEEIQPEDLAVPTFGVFVPTAGASHYQRRLEGAEKELLLQALKQHRGDKQAAARVLGIALSTLYAKLKKYQL
jgi:DNA-binding NtrC family response regulator